MRKIFFFLICSVCVFLVKQQILEKKPRTTLDEYETLTEYNFPIRKFNFKSPRRFSPKRKTTIIHTLIFIKLKYDTYEHKKNEENFLRASWSSSSSLASLAKTIKYKIFLFFSYSCSSLISDIQENRSYTMRMVTNEIYIKPLLFSMCSIKNCCNINFKLIIFFIVTTHKLDRNWDFTFAKFYYILLGK